MIASLYRSIALFILAMSPLHSNGATVPSSKNERGNVAACGGPDAGAEVNEVVEGPIIAIELPMETLVLIYGSARVRLAGEFPFIESIEVAGDTPPETKERRDFGYRILVRIIKTMP
jgi:hypothetical protein